MAPAQISLFLRRVLPLAVWSLWVVAGGAAGCASASGPKARLSQARYQYNRVTGQVYIKALDATNAVERITLLDVAAEEYGRVAREFPDVPAWAAAALRSEGQIRLERGQLGEALTCLEQVGQRYPQEHWEVIQAWKAAADHLWDTRHRGEARVYYRQIVSTYGRPGQPPMFDTIVSVARQRLAERDTP